MKPRCARCGKSFFKAWGETIPRDRFDEQFREQVEKRMGELLVKSEDFVIEELDGSITPGEV